MDSFKQFIGWCVTKLTVMFENNQLPNCHIAPSGGVVIFKHVDNGFPEECQIIFCKARRFSGKVSRDIAFGLVQGIGNNVFAAHFCGFILCILGRSNSHTGNGHFLGSNGIDAPCKAKLYRSTNLSTVQGTFHKCSHNSTKGTDIIEIGTHEITDLHIGIGVFFLKVFDILSADIVQCFFITLFQGDVFFDIDAVSFFAFFSCFHIVADFSLQTYIGY